LLAYSPLSGEKTGSKWEREDGRDREYKKGIEGMGKVTGGDGLRLARRQGIKTEGRK